MLAIRSLIFSLFFYGGSVVLVSVAAASVPFGQAAILTAARRWARWHRWCARVFIGAQTQVIGDLPQAGVIYAIKHESGYEAVETLVLFDRPAVVMKKELVDMFGWGFVARAHGVIPVDREAGAAAMRAMISVAKAAKAAGRPVVIFPEGTRVPHGEQPPLRAGFAGLYKVLGLPVVPIALDSGKIWRKGLIKRPGVVTMTVGEIIPAGLPRAEIERRVHSAINALNDPLGQSRVGHHPGPAR
ncbi:MAG: lysophospholipid acyltransferase family protein [Sphingomonadaceae bacterium]